MGISCATSPKSFYVFIKIIEFGEMGLSSPISSNLINFGEMGITCSISPKNYCVSIKLIEFGVIGPISPNSIYFRRNGDNDSGSQICNSAESAFFSPIFTAKSNIENKFADRLN